MSERRAALRHAVVVPAVCEIPGLPEFHAVTVDLSVEGLRLRSITVPAPGERLICRVRGVGALEARVVRGGVCEFAVMITGLDPPPAEIARRFVELAREQARAAESVRVDRRIVPVRTAVRVTLPDGTGVAARILNLSASGVALQLDATLAIGQEIVVGQRRATVARHIAEGVGAAFRDAFEGAVGEATVL